MQVAVDLDEAAFGAFLNDFLGQLAEGDHGVPLDIFFFAKVALGGHAERGSTVIRPEESRVCAEVAGQDYQIVAEGLLLVIVLIVGGCVAS
jgi:hypothetical protein